MFEIIAIIIASIITFTFLGEIENRLDSVEYVLPATAMSLPYICWLFCGIYRRAKPSPLGLQPISWKKRVGYAYLCNLVYVVVITVAVIVFVILILLLVSILVFMSTGYWIFTAELDWEYETVYAPVMHQLFAAFSALFLYGAGASIAAVKNKKWRIGLYIALPVAIKIFGALVINIAYPSPYIYWYGDVTDILMTSSLSVMWLTFVIVLGVAVTALSVFLNIKAEKPNKV